MNFEPASPAEAVDNLHHDPVPLDQITMVTDPTRFEGGRFAYFVGTKAEAAALAAEGRTPPSDRVVAPEFRAAHPSPIGITSTLKWIRANIPSSILNDAE